VSGYEFVFFPSLITLYHLHRQIALPFVGLFSVGIIPKPGTKDRREYLFLAPLLIQLIEVG
jgi:hypothetical protein